MVTPGSIRQTRGTYVLVAKASLRRQIQIGKRGVLQLQPGWYVYVGSAFGPGGLAARVGRHLRSNKTQRWHIDYLREHVEIVEVWFSESQQRLEHAWASYFLSQERFSIPQQGFGASDCQCATHLFYSRNKPDWQAFHDNFQEFDCQYFSAA